MKTLSLRPGVCCEISARSKNVESHFPSVKVRTFLVRPPPFPWNQIFRYFDAIIFMISTCFPGLFGRFFSTLVNHLSLVLLCLKDEEGVVELDVVGFDWSAWLFEGVSSLCFGCTPPTKKQTLWKGNIIRTKTCSN